MMGKNHRRTKIKLISSVNYLDFDEMDGLDRTHSIDDFYHEYLALCQFKNKEFKEQQNKFKMILSTLIHTYGH